jgi:hypothetical protein
MKAAMITNNWKKPGNSSGLMPLDKSLFDVVRIFIHNNKGFG